MTKIEKFQRRRKLLIYGICIALFGIVFYIVNSLTNLVTQSANWPVLLISIAFVLISYMLYLCPFCGKYPEDSDVPTLNPKQCSKCSALLK